jgi:hydrogenase nickel incorporation protein HypB
MPKQIKILENIFQSNDQVALQNQELFRSSGVYTINLISSPGAGKTSLIEQTIKRLKNHLNIAVVNGDLATQFDKERAEAAGALALNINTGGECHLDAVMINEAILQLDLRKLDLLLIENVGNLICPASFQLGTHHTAVIASVPEGDDKPYKYPGTFITGDIILLNKIDLLPYVPFNKLKFLKGIEFLNPGAKIFEISCLKGDGLEPWCNWLTSSIRKQQNQPLRK